MHDAASNTLRYTYLLARTLQKRDPGFHALQVLLLLLFEDRNRVFAEQDRVKGCLDFANERFS